MQRRFFERTHGFLSFGRLINAAERLVECLPELHYVKTSFNSRIINACPSLKRPYRPTPWIATGHMQTVLGTMLRFRYPVLYERETITYSDGGQAGLDWDSGQNEPHPIYRERGTLPCTTFESETPVIVILPGLTGGSHSKYIRHFVLIARKFGMRTVVANYRGFAGVKVQNPMVSTGVNVSDVSELLHHVQQRYPRAPLLAVGFSMGANILTKYLGLKRPNELGPVAAVAVSNAFDFRALCASLEKPVNNILYSRPLAWLIKHKVITTNQDVFSKVSNIQEVLASRTIKDVDETLCRKCYGLDSVEQYYDESSSLPHLPMVHSPLLCLNAKDDPFAGALPYEVAQRNPHVILAVTNRGGHINFTEGINPFSLESTWMAKVALEFLTAALPLLHTQNSTVSISSARAHGPRPAADSD